VAICWAKNIILRQSKGQIVMQETMIMLITPLRKEEVEMKYS